VVRVRVPASSANVGPGYDSFGLALARYDEVIAERAPQGLTVGVSGIGAGTVPTDERHLVVQAAYRAFEAMGMPVPGLRLECVNRIPHGGGQGSSAAAIVAGIVLARALATGEGALSDEDVFALATGMEGHPDNVAPALYGGFTVAWMAGARDSAVPRAVRLVPDPRVRAMVFTAEESCATSTARAVLPAAIAHGDAAANSARAALLVHALTADPALLFEATVDYLHQGFRGSVMPHTAELLGRLRASGLAAVLSGAGPSVLVLGTDLPEPGSVDAPGFHAELVAVPRAGVTVNGVPFGTVGA
jgi:homoserine kinase